MKDKTFAQFTKIITLYAYMYISDHLDPCSQQRYDKIFLNGKVHDNQYEA